VAGPSVKVAVLADTKPLSDSFDATSKTAESAGARIHSAFSSVLGTLNRAGVLGPFGEALGAVDEAIGKVVEHGKSIGDVMLGVGGALVGVGVGLQAIGSKDKAAHQQLQASVEATGASYSDYQDKVDKAIKGQEKYGTTANVTQDALRKLTDATHDPQKALDLLGTAANVAASKHEDLSTAADQIGKVYNGNTKLLKPYGIELDKTTGLTQDGRTATQALADVTAGQAAAATDTFTGKLSAMRARLEDSASAFGQKYGPAITIAGAAMTGLGAAIETGTAISKAFTTAQEGQAVAEGLTLGPILLIIVAIAALAAAAYLIYRNWDTIWNAMHIAVQTVWDWIRKNWPLLLAVILGPIAIAALEIARHWDAIKGGAAQVVSSITGGFNSLVGFISGLGGRIAGAAWGMFDGLWQAFREAINHIINGWNGLRFGIPEIDTHIPGIGKVGGGDFGVPQIPHLAQGGLITATGLIYAHAGEAITPAPTRSGPAVVVEHATFADDLDIEDFMRKAAWTVQTAGL
jgi:hypothetical protein